MALPRHNEPDLDSTTFMQWYELQPGGKRFELLDGRIYEMQSERLVHAETKQRIVEAFRRQIRELGLACQALGDGMAIKVDNETVFEPDVHVRCGPPLPGSTLLIIDPVIVVEVASPSTQRVDALLKFTRYFNNPFVVHYLIVIPTKGSAIHHQRIASGEIISRSYNSGLIRFDPPGIELDISSVTASGD